MCIFSRRVNSVSKTNIFARVEDGVQYLVYGMNFSAKDEVAMILPVPIEKGFEPLFISLEKYDAFFTDLRSAFPADPQPRTRSRGVGSKSFGSREILAVEKVGAFETSFVPSIDDFDRLAPVFHLPAGTEDAMKKLYANFGFVVFKLEAGRDVKPHPMAFVFKTQTPDQIFFPTVHIHDGKIPSQEQFDHNLYIQMPPGQSCISQEWMVSKQSILMKMKDDIHPNLMRNAVGYRKRISGAKRNIDTVVDLNKVGCPA